MAKKSSKKVTKQLAPEAGSKSSDSGYPMEPEELKGQRQRLKNAAAMGAPAMESSASATTAGLYSSSAAAPPPPLTPLAALWPTPAPAQEASKPSQAPARKGQPGPVKAATPDALPAPAAQPANVPVQWSVYARGAWTQRTAQTAPQTIQLHVGNNLRKTARMAR